MNNVSGINSLSQPNQPTGDISTSFVGNAAVQAFDHLIDQLMASNRTHTVPSEAAKEAREKIEEFEHKLAILTGMVKQAEEELKSLGDKVSTARAVKEQEYFYYKSKLRQVGLADGDCNLI